MGTLCPAGLATMRGYCMAFLTGSFVDSSDAATTRVFRRRRTQLGGCTALSGALVALAVLVPQPARAADECGTPVNGVVTCSGNAFGTGISYFLPSDAPPQDLTVNLDNLRIYTTGSGANGITVISQAGSVTIDGSSSNIFINKGGATGVYASSIPGDASITIGQVETGGVSSTGAMALSVYGNASITADKVLTDNDRSTGVIAISEHGNASADVTTVGTLGYGAVGIQVIANEGTASVLSGGAYTGGDRSIAIQALGNSVDIHTTGTTYTSGMLSYGIEAVGGAGGITINSDGLVKTLGHYSSGIVAVSNGGDIAINANQVVTRGRYANGIEATAEQGAITITGKDIQTSGEYSTGILASAVNGAVAVKADHVATSGGHGYGVFARSQYGAVSVNAGNISTTGQHAAGIVAYSVYGDASLTVGTVATSGYSAAGVFVGGGSNASASVDTVTTSGDGSTGVIVRTGSPRGAGNSVATIGNVTTTGAFSVAVDDAAFGNLKLNVGSVKTTGDYSEGVVASAQYGNSNVTVSSVSTKGSYAAAVDTAVLGGDQSLVIGDVDTAGYEAAGVRTLASHGNTDITINGSVKTAGVQAWGVLAVEQGQGNISIHNNGTIGTFGAMASGIEARTYNGQLDIEGGVIATHGDQADGIIAVAAGATKSITVTAGNVTTSGASSIGINLSTMDSGGPSLKKQGANADQSGLSVASSMAGNDDPSISLNSGTVHTSGSSANAIEIYGTGSVSVNAGNTISEKASAMQITARDLADVSIGGQTVAGATDAVAITGSDVNVSVQKGGSISGPVNALVIDAVGPYVPPVGGGGGGGGVYFREAAVTASSGKATIDNAGTMVGGTGYAVLVNSGTVSLTNNGILQGAVKFADGDDVLTNSGTFVATKDSDFGGGNNLFVNTGKLVVAPGTKPGNITLLGLETFQNSGLIDLRNGVAGDTLTMPGNYVASGKAALGVDLGANGVADKLIVNGSVTGTTSILINATAGNATLLAKPLTLIQAGAGTSTPSAGQPGGGMAANAFGIANQSVGFVTYGLSYNAATNSFQLTAQAGAPVYRFAKVNEAAQAIGQQAGTAWRSHMAELRDMDEPARRVWGQAYGQVDSRHEDRTVAVAGSTAQNYDLGYRQDYFGAQAGVDLGGKRAENGNGLLFGVTGGYLSSHMNFRAGADRVRFDTVNAGGYAGVRAGRLFANLLGQYVHYRTTAFNGVEQWSDKFSGNGYGVQGEVGARLGSDTLFAEPVASLAWQKTDLGTLNALGQSLDFGHDSGLTGSFGARFGGSVAMAGGGKAVFYAKASYVHAFSGKGGVLFTSGGTSEDISGTKL